MSVWLVLTYHICLSSHYLHEQLVLFSTAVKEKGLAVGDSYIATFICSGKKLDCRLKHLGRISWGNICGLLCLLISSIPPILTEN